MGGVGMIVRLAWKDWERLARIGNVAARNRNRPILEAVRFEAEVDDAHVRAVATDAYKLATVSVPAEIDDVEPPMLIPARAVRTVTTAFRQSASIQFGSKFATLFKDELWVTLTPSIPGALVEFSIGERYIGSLSVELVEGKFPTYRALLHKPGAELARSTLARKRKDEIAAYLMVQYGKTYDHEDNSKDTLLNIADDFASKPVRRTIGLNPDHLNDLMRTTKIDYQPLFIEMFGEARPIFFSNPSDKDWQGIQMPVRT